MRNAKPRLIGCSNSSFLVTVTTLALLFPFGCQETLQTPQDAPNRLSVDSLERDATQVLLQALADQTPQVRANAVEVVAATKQIKLGPKIQRLLRDEFVPVRFAAALALGDLRYSLAKRPLTQLLQDPDENIRVAALYALTRLGHAESFELLRKAIASNNQTVRANAALLLGKTGDKSTLTRQTLWWALQRPDSDDRVRFQAAEAIAMLGDTRIYPKLWSMLISAYADDRVMGIKAMGALRTPQAKDTLITMLDDDVLEVRLAAAHQLGTLGDTIGEAAVLDFFTKTPAANLDTQALERANVLAALAIGEIRTERLTKFLPQLLKNDSKFVRLAVAKAVLLSAPKAKYPGRLALQDSSR